MAPWTRCKCLDDQDMFRSIAVAESLSAQASGNEEKGERMSGVESLLFGVAVTNSSSSMHATHCMSWNTLLLIVRLGQLTLLPSY
jgi:hypothetical protein